VAGLTELAADHEDVAPVDPQAGEAERLFDGVLHSLGGSVGVIGQPPSLSSVAARFADRMTWCGILSFVIDAQLLYAAPSHLMAVKASVSSVACSTACGRVDKNHVRFSVISGR
jgi:hypothetical protein